MGPEWTIVRVTTGSGIIKEIQGQGSQAILFLADKKCLKYKIPHIVENTA